MLLHTITEWVEAYRSGSSVRDIALQTGLSVTTVQQKLREQGALKSPSEGADLRTSNSPCPPDVDRSTAQVALRKAILLGWVSADFYGHYPRYVWARIGEQFYMARLTNEVLGEYKGWPVAAHELPTDRQGRLSPGAWEAPNGNQV